MKYSTKIKFLTRRVVLLISIVNSYDRLNICNGCRPSWLTKHLPKKLDKILSPFFDLIFKSSCNNHDVNYYIGGNEKDRKGADRFFKYQMNQALKRAILYERSKYKKLQKTKWYQIKLKNIGRGVYNIYPALKNGIKASGYFLKKQYLKIKIFEYYLLVREFGKESFNFKAPIFNKKQLPSYLPLNKKLELEDKIFVYNGRIYLENEKTNINP